MTNRERNRIGAEPLATRSQDSDLGLLRVHCSYHKCLTVYFEKVMKRMAGLPLVLPGGYRHFSSQLDSFYRDSDDYGVSSINNHAIDLDRFERIRVTRFVRDPRDLIVSGYFFHKRGAERWCNMVDPKPDDWAVVHGAIPESLISGESFAKLLNRLSLEDGLLAEMEFRRHHFQSMRAWPKNDSRVALFRYEDVLGNEAEMFDRMFRFFELPWATRRIGRHYANRFRAGSRVEKQQRAQDERVLSRRVDHIRDPRVGQWREYFSESVTRAFEREHGDLLDRHGYSAS